MTDDDSSSGYRISVESDQLEGLGIDVSVSLPTGVEATDVQQQVVHTYADNLETFVRKNADYGSSFSNGPKIESILKHGEVREEEIPQLMAQQIFVRGFLDKLSRFYTLYLEGEDATVDESVEDTLLDLANYAIMLVSQMRRYDA